MSIYLRGEHKVLLQQRWKYPKKKETGKRQIPSLLLSGSRNTVTVTSGSLATGESWWRKVQEIHKIPVVQSLTSARGWGWGEFTPQRSTSKNHELGLLFPTSPFSCTPPDLVKPEAFSPVLWWIWSVRGEILQLPLKFQNCPWSSRREKLCTRACSLKVWRISKLVRKPQEKPEKSYKKVLPMGLGRWCCKCSFFSPSFLFSIINTDHSYVGKTHVLFSQMYSNNLKGAVFSLPCKRSKFWQKKRKYFIGDETEGLENVLKKNELLVWLYFMSDKMQKVTARVWKVSNKHR